MRTQAAAKNHKCSQNAWGSKSTLRVPTVIIPPHWITAVSLRDATLRLPRSVSDGVLGVCDMFRFLLHTRARCVHRKAFRGVLVKAGRNQDTDETLRCESLWPANLDFTRPS